MLVLTSLAGLTLEDAHELANNVTLEARSSDAGNEATDDSQTAETQQEGSHKSIIPEYLWSQRS